MKVKNALTGNFGCMPRAIWSGAISFGLVNIPVKLYSAVSRKTVRFHQIDAESGRRIRQQRVNPASGDEIPYEQIVKGYEISPDRYVTITPEELEALQPQKTRTIDIEQFVDLEQIDPIYYDHPYYLAPDKGAGKAYKLLLDAMEQADKVAIARVVIRQKENLVALRSYRGALTVETMLFPDEVVDPTGIEEIAAAAADGDVKTTKRELDMAKQLIESLSGDFDPSGYRDEYREAVLDMIERKAAGETITIEAPEPERKEVPDLMAALEASIAASKSPPKKRARASNGSGASKKKKTAAKK